MISDAGETRALMHMVAKMHYEAELPQVQIARAWQTLSIATADLEVAQLLELPLNAPVAEVRRVFCAPDGTVIYLGELVYRGDFIRVDMNLLA